jgi:hypothetical protein
MFPFLFNLMKKNKDLRLTIQIGKKKPLPALPAVETLKEP